MKYFYFLIISSNTNEVLIIVPFHIKRFENWTYKLKTPEKIYDFLFKNSEIIFQIQLYIDA